MTRTRTVVTIGNFDGVHRGHAALIARAREIAAAAGGGTRVVALSFDPHPLSRIDPARAPARLTTFRQRAEFLAMAGADEAVRLEPTGQVLAQTPEAFVERLVHDLAPLAVVEGEDFRFGRGRSGDMQTLRQLGRTHGFEVHTVDPVEVALTDHTVVPARSSLVRWLLGHGRVRDAACVLGRTYEMDGEVIRGDRRGRTIGFPTANLDSACLAPAEGVYAGWARAGDGRGWPAAISVGTKSTFGEHARAVEAYLIGARKAGDGIAGLPEYGWEIRLSFDHWLRDQAKYESLEALLAQMGRDCARAQSLLDAGDAGAHMETSACR